MAIFRYLKTLLENPNPRSRAFLSFHPSATPFQSSSPSPFAVSSSCSCLPVLSPSVNLFSSVLRLNSSRTRFFSPFCKWIPFSGPLFLSSPAWKLLQSATPLYLHGEVVFQIDSSLNFLPRRNLPLGLGFGPAKLVQSLENVVDQKKSQGNSEKAVAESFLNLPNLISISRMVSGPLLGWMIVNEWYVSTFMGLAIAGASDWLDGFIARKMGINSVIGSYLDPLADKVLICCVALAMVKQDLLPYELVALVVLRDISLIGGAFYKRASSLGWEWKGWSDFINLDATRAEKVEPIFLSKVNTVLQLGLVAAALFQPEFGNEETASFIRCSSWLVAGTTLSSWAAYVMLQTKCKSVITASLSRSSSS